MQSTYLCSVIVINKNYNINHINFTKMRKLMTLLTVLVLGTLSNVGLAQSKNGKISGTVREQGDKIIPAASVSLLRAQDSVLVKMAATDKEGRYSFENLPEGRYLVAVTSVGHTKTFSAIFELSAANTTISLQPIEMSLASKSLGGVTVTSRKPLIEQKIDRTIVNVEASISNVGSSALEVLEKSPGITVDKDGNISLKGKQGVIVMIDGRPSYLSGTELANLLRSMNASQLEQIEIMTNPPAKYDAAGNSGIINIKTKKNKVKGFNGSVTIGAGKGKGWRNNESLNLNYRNGKYNLFGSYTFNYRENYQSLDILRKFYNPASKNLETVFDQNASMLNVNRSQSAKIGLDYFASKKTTFGVVFSGFYNPSSFSNDNTTRIFNDANVLQRSNTASTDAGDRWKNWSANLNLRHVFDSTGRELTVDLDYVTYDIAKRMDMMNNYFDKFGVPVYPSDTLKGKLPIGIDIYSGKIDYSHPLKGNAKFEAGLKTSFVETNNNAQYDSLLNNQLVPDLGRSNNFIYRENINAMYVNLSKQLSKKWGIQTGFRVENTNAKGRQLGNSQVAATSFTRNYTQLFPTAYISYTPGEKHQFALSYGRRIERPDYEDMNPFIYFLDKYTFQAGNPDLQPQFAHNIEFSHTFKGFLTTTVNYSNTTNIIQDVLEQRTATNETFIRKSNIATQKNMGLSMSAYTPLKKWWTVQLYANVYNNRFIGVVNNTDIDVNGTTAVFNVNNQFNFGKGWSAEVGGFYRTRGIEGVIVIQPIGQATAGVSKSILKKKGTLRMNMRDIFYTQNFRGASKYADVDASFYNRNDNRVLSLSFTYRFGKSMGNQPKRKTGGAGDEQGRVKNGGN
jgi:iron complex outermembrane recepter protein